MLKARIGRLPVVDPDAPTKLLGYLGRGEFILAYEKSHEEEHRREAWWFKPKKTKLTRGRKEEIIHNKAAKI
jgi:hypothetical protein